MEGAILFTIWWIDIPSANDVLFSPKAFKNVCDFTIKSTRSTTQVICRHFTTAVEVLCEWILLFVQIRNSKDVLFSIPYDIIISYSSVISHYCFRWIGSNGWFKKWRNENYPKWFRESCLTEQKHLKEKGATNQRVREIHKWTNWLKKVASLSERSFLLDNNGGVWNNEWRSYPDEHVISSVWCTWLAECEFIADNDNGMKPKSGLFWDEDNPFILSFILPSIRCSIQ